MPSLTVDPSAVTCCTLPLVSVKRRSRNFTSLSFISFSTSPTFFGLSAILFPLSFTQPCSLMSLRRSRPKPPARRRKRTVRRPVPSNRVGSGLTSADANRFLDGGNEYLAIADATRLRGLLDRFQGLGQQLVGQHHLDLHLRQEIDHVFRA